MRKRTPDSDSALYSAVWIHKICHYENFDPCQTIEGKEPIVLQFSKGSKNDINWLPPIAHLDQIYNMTLKLRVFHVIFLMHSDGWRVAGNAQLRNGNVPKTARRGNFLIDLICWNGLKAKMDFQFAYFKIFSIFFCIMYILASLGILAKIFSSSEKWSSQKWIYRDF